MLIGFCPRYCPCLLLCLRDLCLCLSIPKNVSIYPASRSFSVGTRREIGKKREPANQGIQAAIGYRTDSACIEPCLDMYPRGTPHLVAGKGATIGYGTSTLYVSQRCLNYCYGWNCPRGWIMLLSFSNQLLQRAGKDACY